MNCVRPFTQVILMHLFKAAATWMDLESVIQAEVSQKSKYHILTHICRIQKNGIDALIFKTEIETQM